MDINIALLLATLFTATNQAPLFIPLFESNLLKGPSPRLRHCYHHQTIRWVTYFIYSNDCPAVWGLHNPFQERDKPSPEEICLCFDDERKSSRCIKSTIGNDPETVFKNFPVCWKNLGPSQSRYTLSFPVIDAESSHGGNCYYFSPFVRLHHYIPERWFFGKDSMLNSDKRCNYEILSYDEKLKAFENRNRALEKKAQQEKEYKRLHCKQKNPYIRFFEQRHKKNHR